jgi:uncharacterized protein YecE (DUF72 family)
MEFRHISWFDETVYEVLRSRNVSLCLGDGEMKDGQARRETPFVSTADWGYLRLRRVEYDDGALRGWAEKIRGQNWDRSFVFFKHEDEGAGPRLAARFTELLAT